VVTSAKLPTKKTTTELRELLFSAVGGISENNPILTNTKNNQSQSDKQHTCRDDVS
jgi:hypothetical protein